MSTALLQTTYFGPVQWYQKLHRYEHTLIEQYDSYQKQTFRNIIGTNYAFNDNNSLGFRYTMILRPDYKTTSTVVSDITANNTFYDHLDNTLDTRSSFHPSHLLNVYFRGKIGKMGIDFNTDYLYNKTNGHTTYDERSTDKQSRIVTSDNAERNELIASKLTLDHPLLGGELNVGAEYTHTKRNDDYINAEQYVPTSFAELREQHIAPFVEYSRQFHIGQFSAGLRYEWVDFDYYENSLHLDEQGTYTFHGYGYRDTREAVSVRTEQQLRGVRYLA